MEMIIGMIKIMTLNNANTCTLCEYGIILNVRLPFSLRNHFSKKIKKIQECDQSTKQFGPWSGPLFCWAWSGFEMFAMQKISCTELNVTISINAIIQLLTIEALDMMWYRPESTNIDWGGAEVNIGILRSILYNYWLMRHWIWCDIDQIIPILTEAKPRSILVFSGRYHIISNASLVNNCFII